jgi:uncharacterized protein (DUF885 family)
MSDSAGARLRELLDAYYRVWFRYHPETAVDVGYEGYAYLLTPFGDETRGALVCLNDELLVALDEIDEAALSPDEAIDLTLCRAAARTENGRLLDVEPRCVDPGRLLPVNAIHQLTIREVADLAGSLTGRLIIIPDYLAQARDYLIPRALQVPPLWLRSAVASARHGVEFLNSLPACPRVVAEPLPGLAKLVERAGAALAGFADFLEKDIAPQATGNPACGRAHFEHLLRERHFLDLTADELYAAGERLVAENRQTLGRACRDYNGTDNLAAALARIRANLPPADRLLETYRKAMIEARAFVAARDLVSLPAQERLDVEETPLFLRNQIPFAAYYEPTPRDPAQQGHYYVTPPADAAELAEHDVTGLRHTCVHEAWPGHHLQFVTGNGHPSARTLPRLLYPSATLYEGWALYSEQLMAESGFLGSPASRVLLLRDRLWRALRILIDVEVHTRGVTPETAARRLVDELGFSPAHALAELTWYTRSPTVPLGYAVGWAMINALRQEWCALNPAAPLKEFHDRLLSAGSFALPLVIERVFGASLWQCVRTRVFGERT